MVESVPTSIARCYDQHVEITPLLTPPLSAFAASIVLHLAALHLFPRIGLLDFPERYGLKRPRLPYPTGILTAGALVVFLMLGTPSVQENGLLLSTIALAMICFIDDRAKLPAWLRLLAQICVALSLFVTGTRIYTLTNPLASLGMGDIVPLDHWTVTFPDIGPLPILSGLFTVGWILLTVNALNWFDGVPGQTSLLSTIGFLTIGFLSLSARVDQPELALFAFVLAGLSAGAALFELPLPFQRVVPGDSGAMLLGLLLGVLTIYAGGKVATGFLVLGVPLIDSFIVVARRLWRGKNPMRGSDAGEHLHHRLLQRGWPPWGVIALTTGLGVGFGVAALFLSTAEKFLAAILLAVIISGLSYWSGPSSPSRRFGLRRDARKTDDMGDTSA